MRAYSIAAALLLSVILLSACLNMARPLPSLSVPTMASSSRSVRDLQAGYKQLNSSFRTIPPSTSNPIQNKRKPPFSDSRSKNRMAASSSSNPPRI
ncbi:hypothetical protein K2173_024707 [Erythroxylum novogranatense]|uniref:Uncharacterized protein n=1 Tax=Erythroxylum novogranatense TaxID=1862640 RepID=A0AAV8SV43_9ROSI|nr:hypothetical protein K2173_024707 [Erythroxylum novogranatense]